MNKTFKLSLLLICISAMIGGCKKQNQEPIIEKPVNSKGFHSTLTNEEYSK